MIGFGLFRTPALDYAVPLAQIRRIVQEKAIYPLPGLPTGVHSVLVYESTLVPVLLFDLFHTGGIEDVSLCYALVESEYGLLAFATWPNSRIVAEHRGKLSVPSVDERSWQTGTFNYQERDYVVLNVDVLATEIVRGNGLNCLTLSGARRLNEEETAAGR